MHPSSSPPSHSSSTPELHPVLQAALDSLDVELEEELSLYRRQRYCQAKHGKHIPAWQPAKGTGAKSGAIRSPQLPSMDLSKELFTDQHVTSQPFSSPAMPNAIASGTGSFSATDFIQANESGKTDAAAANFNAASLAIVAALQAQQPPQYAKIATSDKTFDRLRELALRPMSADEWLNQEQENNDFKELTDPEVGAETSHPEAVYPENVYSEAIYPENYPENIYSDSPQSGFFDSPDGYLESTEELLNSIAEEKPDYGAEQESSLLNSLLTPLGIGSMLLLLLSSATLGYVIMHPSSLDLFTSPEKSSANNAADLDGKPASSDFSSPLIPDAPNLAADEFVDLNLGNLSTVPGSNAPSPLPGRSPLANSQLDSDSASQPNLEANSQSSSSIVDTQVASQPSSLPAENSADFAPAVPAPVADPEPDFADTESAPVSTSPSLPAIPTATSEMPETVPDLDVVPSDVPVDAPVPDAPAAVATAPATPTAGGTYYVVTPYNGDPSLEQARQAVPEAYVRNFETGATVQLGVFNNAENAQELLQELQNQGIQAEVYQP